MKKVLIIGANGQIAKKVVGNLVSNDEVEFVLTSRSGGDGVIKLDAIDQAGIEAQLDGVDIVYTNFNAEEKTPDGAKAIIAAMKNKGVDRLVWIATVGMYDELTPEYRDTWNKMLGPVDDPKSYFGAFRIAADLIEESGLDYTIIRPTELSDADVMQNLTIQEDKEQLQNGSSITRTSVANFVENIILDPSKYSKSSVAISGK